MPETLRTGPRALPRADATLAQLVHDRGILWSTPGAPVLGRDGVRADWMLYTYPLTLSGDGGAAAAAAMLPVLRTFEARQVVSIGYTAIPLVADCVLHARGELVGGCIRETRKAHGSGRRVEGDLDRTRPVVVVDDSISSGTSVRTGIEALEAEGFEVEGAVALVAFPWRGGIEQVRAQGYRVETVLDIWRDVGMPLADHVHDHACVAVTWADAQATGGLHPAVLAREVADELLRSGRTLRPPAALDADYDGRGGVYVSFRDRRTDARLARSGFWHFDPALADPARDVVLATARTLAGAAGRAVRAHGLDDLKVGVSFLGPLQPVAPRDLDFGRLGVVVQSLAQPGKVGGALPHTEVFTSEIQQYRHAAFRNARLGRTEPHQVFVHTVRKVVEPGESWLPYGSSDDAQERLPLATGEALTTRARDVLDAFRAGREPVGPPVPDELVPDPVRGVGVTLYAGGVLGCCVSSQGSLDECLVRATRRAATDPRFTAVRDAAQVPPSICVSILRDQELLGVTADLERALVKVRPGHDTVAAQHGDRAGLLLAQVPVHHDWSKPQLARQLLAKARIDGGTASWSTFRTASWLRREDRVWPVVSGYPVRDAPRVDVATIRSTLALLAGYVIGQLGPDGLPAYAYQPVTGRTTTRGTAGRALHALTALADAADVLGRDDLRAAAAHGLSTALRSVEPIGGRSRVALPGLTPGTSADAELVLGAAALGDGLLGDDRVRAVHRGLVGLLRPDGRIDPERRRRWTAEHDFLPGLALLAAAAVPDELPDLTAQLAWYRRRFDLLHPWGMVGWHPQAWFRVAATGHAPDGTAAFVREVVDWALPLQHRGTGAFLTDLDVTGPGFHTAFVLEGVADAARLCLLDGDRARAALYMRRWRQGFRFVDRLVVRDEDTYCMADPGRALGAVRPSLTTSGVRIDFVSHAMQALVKALRYAETAEEGEVERDD
ncbi:AMMECR1 domain-containing protein [Cellulomonas alba]|uniref:AMMECR1 domain-containing protein n=1 Tax=Cellulomonas alba TaxID=3053467 RepID=A0ABT7SCG3_9CELL|nr:AMMECR1 domain-containing protein [Cellulomonas alba]MDM7853882.1 AMMECR1 domain-containing protein [Cellulomonas alba]